MKISGYGEFQQMRKLIQKEDQRGSGKAPVSESEAQAAGGDGDAVHISAAARRRIRLLQTPETREAKMAAVRERLENGSLVTPESLSGGTERMLRNLISGESPDL